MSASSSMTSTEIWPSRIVGSLYWANGAKDGSRRSWERRCASLPPIGSPGFLRPMVARSRPAHPPSSRPSPRGVPPHKPVPPTGLERLVAPLRATKHIEVMVCVSCETYFDQAVVQDRRFQVANRLLCPISSGDSANFAIKGVLGSYSCREATARGSDVVSGRGRGSRWEADVWLPPRPDAGADGANRRVAVKEVPMTRTRVSLRNQPLLAEGHL
jgi:hypothetical protein